MGLISLLKTMFYHLMIVSQNHHEASRTHQPLHLDQGFSRNNRDCPWVNLTIFKAVLCCLLNAASRWQCMMHVQMTWRFLVLTDFA